MAYTRNPRKRIVRGDSDDELRRVGRRTSEEMQIGEGDDLPFVRLGSSTIGTQQDVVQRIGDAIIGGDFSGNARGSRAVDIQLDRMTDNLSSTPDATKVASGDGSVAIGRTLKASGFQAVAIGVGAQAGGDYAAALGRGGAMGDSSFAVGGNVSAAGSQGIAIGDQAFVTASGGIAIGGIAEATAAGAIAIGGNETYATAQFSIAVGEEARADGVRSVAIGYVAGYADDSGGFPVASGARSVALGYGAYTAVADQAVIAATTLKMQTARVGASPPVFTYESVITTSAVAPTTGNVATWADVDRIGDGGVALSALAPLASPTFTGTLTAPTIVSTSVTRLKGYTVATLPAGTQGDTAFVTDALAPAFLVAVAGGGAVVAPVFYNGAAWVVG